MSIRLVGRRAVAWLLNRFYPGYGGCFRCRRNWKIARAHVTHYSSEDGMFPLCQVCWQECSIRERLIYHHVLWLEWQQVSKNPDGIPQWPLIEQAVRGGQ